MLVKIIHLDEPRCGSRINKNEVQYWYRKVRYQKMEDEINDFIRKISPQGYDLVDLKINWQSNTATILYETKIGFRVPDSIDDAKKETSSLRQEFKLTEKSENDWVTN